jgi:hypothetical protein
MKTLFEKFISYFETVAHPAADNRFKPAATQRKRKSGTYLQLASLSPECYNVRGVTKKASDVRRTPAP